jgi:WD40 repeat protein
MIPLCVYVETNFYLIRTPADCVLSVQLWNVDTGECLHVMRGHFHQIYSVVFDGVHIASGGLDTTVRVWNATNGYDHLFR